VLLVQCLRPKVIAMTLCKPDHPRRIDGLIDYFGDPAHGETPPVPVPDGGRDIFLLSRPTARSGVVRLAVVSMSALVLVAGCAKRPAVLEVSAPAPTGQSGITAPAAAEPAPRAVVGAAPSVAPEATTTAPAQQVATPAPAPAASEGPSAPAAPTPSAPPAPAPPATYAPVAELADIHFDFDRSDIRPGDARILERNAEWLLANPDRLILIEGHCDERGTNAYNLALGDRRAQATREFLAGRGVSAGRMMIISYGEERPQCTERDEACWSKNRRSHFLTKRG
jgi:peptidoglycan-associated lipoprotein